MEIDRKLLERMDAEGPVALLLVVGAIGSTPQRVGAKALVDRQGRLVVGTVGGGLMESKALANGAKVLEKGIAHLDEFSMDEPYSRAAGPICGGTMRILAAPCRPESQDAYKQALKAMDARRKGLLLTIIAGREVGCTRWLDADAIATGASGIDVEQLTSFLESETPGAIVDRQSDLEIFVEPVSAPPRMLVVGGGHVGQAIVQQATWLGFDVTVLDDRTEFAQSDRFPAGTRVVCGAIRQEVEQFPKERDSFIVLVSKGHKPDAEALEGCIHSEPAYIGMIGSRRKISLLRKHFLESGLATKEQFARIFAPIGLGIGAVTVEEIATSVMAQVVAVRRQGRANYKIDDMVLP